MDQDVVSSSDHLSPHLPLLNRAGARSWRLIFATTFSKMKARPFQATFVGLITRATAVLAISSLSLKVTGLGAVHHVDNLKVHTILTNTGNETLKLLNDPRGPLSKMPTDTFVITNAKGGKPSFRGMKVKYVPSTAAAQGSYTILSPGQVIEVEHSLADAYDFRTPGEGSYDIAAKNIFYSLDDSQNIIPIRADVSHGKQRTRLSGRLYAPRPVTALSKRTNFIGCSSSEESQIYIALVSANSYASSALTYLNGHLASTKRYATWFGSYTPVNHDTVTSHFNSLSTRGYASFTYNCSCTDSNTYAYVYADTYGTIYLCGAFWNAPNTGTDSKAGTLIHESSHFTENGGTGDYVYGQDAAKELAKSNPSQAIMNADSHEYFAENNPVLL